MRDVVEDEGEESGLIKGGRERSVGAALHWHRRLSCALASGVLFLALADLLLAASLWSARDGGPTAGTAQPLTSGCRTVTASDPGDGRHAVTAVRVPAFEGPEIMVVAGVTLPPLQPREVRVDLSFAGINPVETYVRAGTYANLPSLPFTLGDEGSGIMAAVGAHVTLNAGDPVNVTKCITGSYATACNALATDVHPLPAGLPLELGCGLGTPYPAAYCKLQYKCLLFLDYSIENTKEWRTSAENDDFAFSHGHSFCNSRYRAPEFNLHINTPGRCFKVRSHALVSPS